MKARLQDRSVHLHHQTTKAILVSLDGVRSNAVWVPKSVVEVYPHLSGDPTRREITLPAHFPLTKDTTR